MLRTLTALCLFSACIAFAEAPPEPIVTTPTTQALTLGKTVMLKPHETAAGENVRLRLDGYGHEKDAEGKTHAYVDLTVEIDGKRRALRIWQEKDPNPRRVHGYEIRMTDCEDHGPPHSATARTTLVVMKLEQTKPG